MSDLTVPVIPWDEITLSTKLGEGGFGIVYQGTWTHGGEVAIKQIKGTLGEDAEQEFKAEAGAMARLNSPYIIRLFGICWEHDKYAMVMELMPNASLYHLLHTKQELPWNLRYNIAKDIAYGLRLLHARKTLHRDLKSLNVLLDDKLRAKLTDFGLAKVKIQSKTTSKAPSGSVGTISWMAPELFGLKPKYSENSDVYAYGITAWELASRETPYKDVADREEIKFAVVKGDREEIPATCPQTFAGLIQACWDQNPSKRPTMDTVVTELEQIIVKEAPAASAPNPVYLGTSLSSQDMVVTQVPKSKSPQLPAGTSASPTPNEYELGLQYYNQNQYQKALSYFLKISLNEGHPYYLAACFKLWRIYKSGLGVSIDSSKAEVYGTIVANNIIWFVKQAEKGIPDAQTNLAVLYHCGHGVPKDYAIAIEWYKKAAAQGNSLAQNNLGCLYRDGYGVTQDYAQACSWFEKAVAQGYAFAQINLGCMFRDGQGVPQDYLKALDWYEKAAAQENAFAQSSIGDLYRDGHGVIQDYVKAKAWYERAAAQGEAFAQTNLGLLYKNGQGITQNYAIAIDWYEKAAAQGNAFAQTSLGDLFRDGLGVTRDYAKALDWYKRAAEHDHADAQTNLGFLYYHGFGVKQDYAQAKAWYEKAAVHGQVDAQTNLGFMYHHGQGTSKDYTQAKLWYEKAIAQGGSVLAKENLAKLPGTKLKPH